MNYREIIAAVVVLFLLGLLGLFVFEKNQEVSNMPVQMSNL